MKVKVNKVTLQTMATNIWELSVDAIVNPVGTDLALRPDLATYLGSEITRELQHIGHCPVGSAVTTLGGNTTFDRIFHAVGPRWGEGSERGKLMSVTFECLRLTEEAHLKSIAMPAISIGSHGYPLENCATTMLTQIIDYTFEDLKYLRRIVLCLETHPMLEAFDRELKRQMEELGEESAGEARV
jgi:O-acetyl-ADP-ribose deacetylase (regulator of RNase III)